MRRALVVLSLVVMSCPKAPPKVEAPKPVPPREAVVQVLEKAYRAMEKGDADALDPLFTDDAFVFGLGPADAWSGRKSIVDHLRQTLLPIGLSGDELAIINSAPVVGLASEDYAAWAFDLLKVTTKHKGKTETWLPRVTVHFVREGDRWRIDAMHVSLSVADELVSAPDAAKKLLAPIDVPNDRSPDSEQIVGVVKRSLEDYGVKVDRTSERAEFVQLGTSAAEVFIGGKNFKELLKPQLAAIKKAGYAWKLDGNIRVKLEPGGKAGWAAAIVVQKVGTGKKAQTYPPFRFLWTLVEENGFWNITSEHQSLAVKEDLRSEATADDLKTWDSTRALLPKPLKEAPKAEPAPKPDAGSNIGAW